MSDDSLPIAMANELSAVPDVAKQVETFCRDLGISERTIYKFSTALDETLTNAISYGFPDGGHHRIEVRIEHHDGQLIATVSDDGQPFNPLSQPEPDLHAPIEDRKIGGLGIHLVRKLMDVVEYRRVEGRNQLTFRIRAVTTIS